MKKILNLSAVFVLSATVAFSQNGKPSKKEHAGKKTTEAAAVSTASKISTPLELAKAALAAHGGDKFRLMKTLVVRGSVDISGSPTQSISGTFATIYSGEKYRLEVNSFPSFKQTFDGTQTVSSQRGFELPPLNRLGLPLLSKVGEKDFAVSELPEKSGKKAGFRITSPEGFYTDFFVDEKTGLIKSYESSYEIGDRTATTSVAIDKIRDVDGVKIPERYAQRLDFGSLTVYADFKAKDILVNSTVADDVFK